MARSVSEIESSCRSASSSGACRLDGMVDDRVQVDDLLAKLDASARDPRDVEQVFEQPGHVLDLALGDIERLFDQGIPLAPAGG